MRLGKQATAVSGRVDFVFGLEQPPEFSLPLCDPAQEKRIFSGGVTDPPPPERPLVPGRFRMMFTVVFTGIYPQSFWLRFWNFLSICLRERLLQTQPLFPSGAA